jgi:hypothetical protein
VYLLRRLCRLALTSLLGTAALPALAQTPSAMPPACGQQVPAAGRQLLNGPDGLQLAWAPQPAKLVVGQTFALLVQVCPAAGQPMPAGLQVDADMPAHRHGMNYLPSVQATGAGVYRVQGLMLHMPGQWRWRFALTAPLGAAGQAGQAVQGGHGSQPPLRLQQLFELQ